MSKKEGEILINFDGEINGYTVARSATTDVARLFCYSHLKVGLIIYARISRVLPGNGRSVRQSLSPILSSMNIDFAQREPVISSGEELALSAWLAR